MKKKAIKVKDPDLQQEIRNVGAMVEHFGGQLKFIAENFIDMKKDISDLKEDMTGVKQDVITIKQTQESHTEMIGQLMVNVSVLKTDVSEIKSNLKQKADTKDFKKVEQRVVRLEAKTR